MKQESIIKNSMQKKFIIFLIVLFISSSAYLLYSAKNYNDPNYNKNWWAIYFENPKSNCLNFVIENHSDKNSFHYIVIAGGDKIEKDVLMNKGEIKNIKLENIDLTENKKITIQVVSGDERREIYKNL